MSLFRFLNLSAIKLGFLSLAMMATIPSCTSPQAMPATQPTEALATQPAPTVKAPLDPAITQGKVIVMMLAPVPEQGTIGGEPIFALQQSVVSELSRRGWNATASMDFPKALDQTVEKGVAYGREHSAEYIIMGTITASPNRDGNGKGNNLVFNVQIIDIPNQKAVGGIRLIEKTSEYMQERFLEIQNEFSTQACEQMEKLRLARLDPKIIPGKVVVAPFLPLLKDAEDQGEGVLMQRDVVAALSSKGWNATAGNKFERNLETDLTTAVANYGRQQSAQYVIVGNYTQISENEIRLIGQIIEVQSQTSVGGMIANSKFSTESGFSFKQAIDDFDQEAFEQMEKLRAPNSLPNNKVPTTQPDPSPVAPAQNTTHKSVPN